MNKIFDYVAVRVATFILLLIWFNYLWGFAIGVLSAAVAVTVMSAALVLFGQKKKRAPYNADILSKHIAVSGNVYALNLFFKAEGLLLQSDEKSLVSDKTLYYSAYRFGDCGADDVAAAYREAEHENCERIMTVCSDVTRQAIALADTLPIAFSFVKTPYIYKRLKQKNALPDLFFTKKTAFHGFSFGNLLNTVFAENNTKFFVFSGSILAVMSFITPLKLYYIVMSSLSLLAAIATVVYPKLKASLSTRRR
jgi:hypothetical protein